VGHMKSAVLSLSLLIATSGAVQAQDMTAEVWSVCGYDGLLTWHDTRLVFTEQTATDTDVALAGYFDWRSSAGHSGRERFTGTIGSDGELTLQGLEMEGSDGLVTSLYVAQVSGERTQITDGVWLDGAPGIWAAVRDGGRGTAEALCSGEAQLS
jgi:hypothetical protein